jgi:hypothetical protein
MTVGVKMPIPRILNAEYKQPLEGKLSLPSH